MLGSKGSVQSPNVAWPLQITEDQAMRWVQRRLPKAESVRAELYHHPMLGVVFRWTRPWGKPIFAHALVDLVGGRAYAAEHWDDVDFVPIEQVRVSKVLTSPNRLVPDAEALASARQLIQNVLLRRRKIEFAGRLEQWGEPLFFGKPNWWIEGVHEGRRLEVTIDGLNGNYYIFAA